ncbi:MMPL/RND family transporter [Mycobacterium montefiorense]|uniref:Membrane protein, MmpL family n=1 Tax=Mycobacterium montefiorense TaxID=154654 RepID=A0AA37UMB5_9MYCO|nr:MMPL family transporter [Mycobacterium montefiorense]GBG39930.1 putative membrane protein, MmpL family [Mycobacterium montefiorense]GKU33176.1 putative membrane protein, MmpL family [Mycobacterium montefiorense]GKU39822.1 putative membrane protein, MmpL family [Mycobacterium montefiorense]GKU43740.1 putative membrane protein, MmpL family [Mycobacterium montefiorense]GKU53287.1 putative membrane protein, MmpL family [Mycobacterium montefiorense]
MRRLADFVVRWPWAVIGLWVAIAVALPLTLPSLGEMAQKHPLAILPSDAPSSVTARKMTEAFHESGSEDLMLVVLTDDKGLNPADEATYRKLVDALHQDTRDVLMVQDFLSTPPLRSVVTSKDHKAWVVPVGVAGELGTPASYAAFNRISDIVKHNVTGTSLTANVTGPAATVADLTVAGDQDRLPIELAIAVLVLIVLLVIYRSAVTMLLPLLTIGISLVIAQAVVAGYSQLTGSGVSNQSIVFLSAIMAGAGTDYAVFLISRYHDYLRSGADFDKAIKRAMISIGKVIGASAATVGITFLLISFAQMGVFKTVGAASAIGIGVAFLAAVTLLPAILVLAGPRGWVKPRRELTARFWRRSGIRIVRRPKANLVASVLVLIILASSAGLVRYNYDDRKALPSSAPSSAGYTALDRHFPVNQSIPEYILIQSPHDLRTPKALADLEQMADRVSQLPNIAAVSGITRPTGNVPEQFRATYQAGAIGTLLAGGSTMINDHTSDLNRLVAGAGTMANSLGDVRGQIAQLAASVQELDNAFSSAKSQYSGDALVKEVDIAAQLVDHVNALSNAMGWNFSAAKNIFAWIGPVLMALQGNPICDADASCSSTRGTFEQLVGSRDQADLDAINELAHQLQDYPDKRALKASTDRLRAALGKLTKVLHSMGMDKPGGLQANLNSMQDGANRLAGGSRQVADAVAQLVDQVKQLGAGLSESAAFLLSLKRDAAQPAMAGFNIPPQLLHLEEFQKAAKVFISPDGHSVRYLVQTKLNPFSTEAMDQVNAISAAARGAQPNTALSDASISMAGYTVGLKDTRDYYQHDIRFIIAVTLLVVLVTLIALLRAIVAPLYLVASVVISYLSAVGIGVLVFQYMLGQQLHWSVPPLAFVVLVAVGADYNMLLVSRMREESPHSMRYSIIRTLGSTGGVITAAGLIFAASMCGLLFSSIGTVVQGGFVIGVGILLDTFLVRTITVPAIAALVGRANWWPSRMSVRPAPVRRAEPQPN